MDLQQLKSSTKDDAPPGNISLSLTALWHDAKGDWDRAHDLLQDDSDWTGSWVHAYLHRKEGDLVNAAYWYRRAKKPVCNRSLEAEWDEIVESLLLL